MKTLNANKARKHDSGNRKSEIGNRNESVEGVKHFIELDAWKLGQELTVKTYKWTRDYPDNERFGLVSQMRRACISITSNIAEGLSAECTKVGVQLCEHIKQTLNGLIRKMNNPDTKPNSEFRIPNSDSISLS